jgi:hypothetical protein
MHRLTTARRHPVRRPRQTALPKVGILVANATCGSAASCAEGLRPSAVGYLIKPDFSSSRRLSLREEEKWKRAGFARKAKQAVNSLKFGFSGYVFSVTYGRKNRGFPINSQLGRLSPSG